MVADNIWAPVVAALGSSALTLLGAWGLDRRRDSHAAVASQADRRRAAYGRLLATSGRVVIMADALHATIMMTSTLEENLDVVAGVRKRVDTLEVSDRLRRDLDPMFDAWSDVCLDGSAEAVKVASDLIGQAADLLSLSTAPGEGRGKLAQKYLRQRWMPEQLEELDKARDRLGAGRRAFVRIARAELGLPIDGILAAAPEDDQSPR